MIKLDFKKQNITIDKYLTMKEIYELIQDKLNSPLWGDLVASGHPDPIRAVVEITYYELGEGWTVECEEKI